MTRRHMRPIAVVAAAVTPLLIVAAPAGATQQGASQNRPARVRACTNPAPQHASCLAVISSAVGKPSSGYGPADIKSIYGIDTTRGTGQTVAIVDAFDDPHAAADLAAYRTAWKLPACTTANGCLRKVNQRGGHTAPPPDPGWALEISLDLDAVSAACPHCKILLVEADTNSFDDLGTAVNQAVTLGAKIVSNSYGGPEYNGVLAAQALYYNHPGVAMVVATGDTGFGPATFPADATRSIAVGGTTVTKTGTTWAQSAWAGASSGCSAWITKPTWQKDTHCLMRTTADISALADPDTGLAVYDTYQLPLAFGVPNGWITVGGTSLATPLISAMIGLAGNATALATAQHIYTHTSSLRDVVGGSNGSCGGDYLCNALKGYDGPTGNGTPFTLAAL